MSTSTVAGRTVESMLRAGTSVISRAAVGWSRVRVALGEPPSIDIVIAVLFVILTISTTSRWSSAGGFLSTLVGLAIGVSSAAGLVWRRSHAVTLVIAGTAGQLLVLLLRLDVYVYTWYVMIYSVIVYRPPRVGVSVLAAVLAVIPLGATLRSAMTRLPYAIHLTDWTGYVLPTLAVVTAWAAAVGADRRRSEARRTEAEQVKQIESLARHRSQIAGDLNTVVAVEVRRLAELTRDLVPTTAGVTLRLTEIRTRARSALTTLRRSLERMRTDTATPEGSLTPLVTSVRHSRRPTPSGLLVAGLVATTILLVDRFPWLWRMHEVPNGHLAIDTRSGWAVSLLVVQVIVLAWWRSEPAIALLVDTAALIASSALDANNYIAATAPALLYYTTAAGTPIALSAAVVSVAVLAQVSTYAALNHATNPLSIVVVVLLWVVGVLQRRSARDTERLRAVRMSTERRAALDTERDRITRELHDLVGHHLSALALQADTAHRAAARGLLDAETLEHLADSAANALDGVPAVTSPERVKNGSLTLSETERLVAPLRTGGLLVTLEVTGDVVDHCDAAQVEIDLVARRILQEALTNVVRHGGSAPTRVSVHHTPDALNVSVLSESPTVPPASTPGTGQGLRGMQERVDLVGGTLESGPRQRGGWCVCAHLPRR